MRSNKIYKQLQQLKMANVQQQYLQHILSNIVIVNIQENL